MNIQGPLQAVTSVVMVAAAQDVGGQALPVGPFSGALHEGFEAMPQGFAAQLVCFDGEALATQFGGAGGLAVVNGWGGASGTMYPHGGTKFMGGWTNVSVEWVFGQPVRRFGGYFGTQKAAGGATAQFFDASGALIATMPVACPNGTEWAWDGWRAAGPGFTRVRMTGLPPDAGRVMHDDLELDFDYCYPDCNANAFLGLGDFACFQQKFVAQDPYADCNGDGLLTIADFSCFQMSFVAGCP